MKHDKRKIIICSVIAAAAVALLAVGLISHAPRRTKAESFVADIQKGEKDTDNYEELMTLSSGEALLLDKSNGNIAFSCGRKTFLSASENAAGDKLAALLYVTVRDKKGNSYTFSSTDNSVAFGTFDVKYNSDSVKLNFVFSENKASASSDQNSGIRFTVPLDITIADGGYRFSVNCADISLSEGITVEKISIMPGLFSVESAQEDESYIIPDGCGAIVNIAAKNDLAFDVSLPVYGSDVTFKEYDQGAYLPYFAYFRNGVTVCSVIENGDALSDISCKRTLGGGGGSLFNTFTVTPYSSDESGAKKGASYNGELVQTYYFSVSEKPDYNACASYVRTSLIKRRFLSQASDNEFLDLPVFLNSCCSTDGRLLNVLTSFEDAEEIITIMKAKGVKNTALLLSGVFSGGIASSDSPDKKMISSVGDKKTLEALTQTAADNNSTVWVDIDLFSSGKPLSSFGGMKKDDSYSGIKELLGMEKREHRICSLESFAANTASAYEFISSVNISGVRVLDASKLLYSDPENGYNRQDALENAKAKIDSLSVAGDVMLAYPAVYLMKNAFAVTNVPTVARYGGLAGISSVPVLQLVIHGSVSYSTPILNPSDDMDTNVLKAAEYASCLQFFYNYSDESGFGYGRSVSAVGKYSSVLKKMKSVNEMSLTSHEQVMTGVFKLTFDYNKVLYVNYNPSDASVDGVIVPANGLLLV